ncbi:SDR family NAD(P)-dependent oxidoreductase [Paraburkholderia silvatlantica]|uniref:SDR family NAD(P)-dependent oxidoreductase n=1 Tax=Paraburkholderia silvatlantica TaxID=321895 RepID=UPI00105BF4B2|nr:SDR family oxidoreductase [Paraburkholderia silvatlantica]TDQ89542.1 NAD(P)-dependent dehydrogenase (short-subunit alcohol dehydrogenase family) [Paraburkholderia silvatlantica]
MTDLSGRTALVTGGSRGIGRATSLSLAKAGARVIVHYGTSVGEAESVVEAIRSAGGAADTVGADLNSSAGPSLLAEQIGQLVQRLDIVVANAGTGGASSIADQQLDHFDRMYAVNVRAPFFLVQKLLPLLGEGSSIVVITSLAARAVVGDLSAYAATKGAAETMVRHFASKLGGQGIRVNALAPGVVDTEISSFTKTECGRDYALGLQVLKRIATPEDIAPVVRFLVSDDARWITGASIAVDGGSRL